MMKAVDLVLWMKRSKIAPAMLLLSLLLLLLRISQSVLDNWLVFLSNWTVGGVINLVNHLAKGNDVRKMIVITIFEGGCCRSF